MLYYPLLYARLARRSTDYCPKPYTIPSPRRKPPYMLRYRRDHRRANRYRKPGSCCTLVSEKTSSRKPSETDTTRCVSIYDGFCAWPPAGSSTNDHSMTFDCCRIIPCKAREIQTRRWRPNGNPHILLIIPRRGYGQRIHLRLMFQRLAEKRAMQNAARIDRSSTSGMACPPCTAPWSTSAP
jgi:hypothetical protein